jgi:hypothetical protein
VLKTTGKSWELIRWLRWISSNPRQNSTGEGLGRLQERLVFLLKLSRDLSRSQWADDYRLLQIQTCDDLQPESRCVAQHSQVFAKEQRVAFVLDCQAYRVIFCCQVKDQLRTEGADDGTNKKDKIPPRGTGIGWEGSLVIHRAQLLRKWALESPLDRLGLSGRLTLLDDPGGWCTSRM